MTRLRFLGMLLMVAALVACGSIAPAHDDTPVEAVTEDVRVEWIEYDPDLEILILHRSDGVRLAVTLRGGN